MWLCVDLRECLDSHWSWLLSGQIVQTINTKAKSQNIWPTMKSNNSVLSRISKNMWGLNYILSSIWRWKTSQLTLLGWWASERHLGESQGDAQVVHTLQSEIWAPSVPLRSCVSPHFLPSITYTAKWIIHFV